MRIILILSMVFFVNNLANASNFELTIHLNLGASTKHGIVKCRQGGKKLYTRYNLLVFKDKPKYTILRNLDLDKDLISDSEGSHHCHEGEFTLTKLISTPENFIDLFVYLVEIYFIKDAIFKVANIGLSSDEDYFIQYKFINETGQVIETAHTEESVGSVSVDSFTDNGTLIYLIEIKRK